MKKLFTLAAVTTMVVATASVVSKIVKATVTETEATTTTPTNTTDATEATATAEVATETTEVAEAEDVEATAGTEAEDDDEYSLGICDIPNEHLLGYEAPKRKHYISFMDSIAMEKISRILCDAEKEWGVEILIGCHMITYKRREDEYIGKEVTPLLRESIQSWCNTKAEGKAVFDFKDFIVWC